MTRIAIGLTLVSALFANHSAVAESASERTLATQQEINQTVWKPFQQAFEGLDGAALNNLYAEDVLRVTPAGIDTEGQFKSDNESRFDNNKARGDDIELTFWFDSRRTNAATSYEVGFYRLGTTSATGTTDYFYGQFHIVLRKLDGRWKITQDWDTESIGGQPITAADFARQPPARF